MQDGIPSVASIRSARTPRAGLRRLQDVPKTPHKRAPSSPRRPQEGLLEPPWSLPEPTQSCLNFRQGSQSLLEPPWSLPGASPELPGILPGASRDPPGPSLEALEPSRSLQNGLLVTLKSMTGLKHNHLYCCILFC